MIFYNLFIFLKFSKEFTATKYLNIKKPQSSDSSKDCGTQSECRRLPNSH